MEQNEENIIHVQRSRSYTACIIQGISVSFRHLGQLLRYVWPSMLLSSILTFPFIIFFAGQVDAILRKWIELGYLPKVTISTLKKEVIHCTKRDALSFLLLVVLSIVVIAITVLPIIFGFSFWYSCLAFVILALLFLPFDVCFMRLSYTDEPFISCLKGYRAGWRNYGRLFAFELLSYILYSVVTALCCLPVVAIAFVIIQVNNATLNGDVVDLPTLFPFYAVAAYMACVAIDLVCVMMFCFCRCLMWGSLVEEVPADSEVNG